MDSASLLEGIAGLLTGLAIAIVFNAVLIWFITKFLINLGDDIPFKKCINCAIALAIVQVAALLCRIFIPFIGFIVALVVWYKGSVAAIEGSLEATKGGFTILFICTIVSGALSFVIKSGMGG